MSLNDERINEMWYVQSIESYSAIKRDEVLLHAIMWVNLENILREKKPVKKDHKLYNPIYTESLE